MQAEARLYLNGKDYGVISADRAADRLREKTEKAQGLSRGMNRLPILVFLFGNMPRNS
jgi:hypothetical protein